jgi:sialic acid synthase SpsE
VIEKHLTTDRLRPGPDHSSSLEPQEFAELIAGVRTVERALGSSEKHVTAAEIDTQAVVRKSLHATRGLSPTDVLAESDLTALRPEGGLQPSAVWDWLGRHPSRRYSAGEEFRG